MIFLDKALSIIFALLFVACSPKIQQVHQDEPVSSLDEVPKEVLKRPQEPQTQESVYAIEFTTPTGQFIKMSFKSPAKSVGKVNDGHILNGKCLRPLGPGYKLREPELGCATDEVINLMMFSIGEVLRAFPDSPALVLGTLSKKDGGPVPPNKSHQSGRDVDIGFYARNSRPLDDFDELDTDEIDFTKTFYLMANLIATGRVQLIMVNYALHPHLYNAAKDMGYSDEQLAWLFQYPMGPKAKAGIIRHAKGHRRHFHVRFNCPIGDDLCVP